VSVCDGESFDHRDRVAFCNNFRVQSAKAVKLALKWGIFRTVSFDERLFMAFPGSLGVYIVPHYYITISIHILTPKFQNDSRINDNDSTLRDKHEYLCSLGNSPLSV